MSIFLKKEKKKVKDELCDVGRQQRAELLTRQPVHEYPPPETSISRGEIHKTYKNTREIKINK